ncbi:concanavalin A-like lectin/glucanase domain-containing protein, partial [Amylostereum chailletii]
VKSYANVLSSTAKGVQLSALTTAPTAWSWDYDLQSSGIRADVSYDIWLGVAPSGTAASKASSYEMHGDGFPFSIGVIIDFLSFYIQPVGSQVTAGAQVGNHTWNVWTGPNANWEVISFVSAAGDINSFNADLKDFFDYIVANHGVASSQYVQAIQTGTEPFTGSANLMIHSFSVALN